MTTACIIAAVLILIAGLFAVIVERTNERDDARAERDRLERELEARPRLRLVTERHGQRFGPNVISLGGPGDVPTQRDPEHDHLKADDEIPQADESWLAETPLFRDRDGRWV